MKRLLLVAFCVSLLLLPLVAAEPARPAKVLFLGANGPHPPAACCRQLQPILEKRGIELTDID